MYLLFVHSDVVSKKEQMKKWKRSFSNNWLMVRLNLSSDDIKNCKETTTFVKECKKIIEYKKKEILNWAYKQGLSFEKSKEKSPMSLKKVIKKRASKNR